MPSKDNYMKNTFQSVAGYKLLSAIIRTFQNHGNRLSIEELYTFLPEEAGYELSEDELNEVASILDGYTMENMPYDAQDGKVLHLFEEQGDGFYVLNASEETLAALQMEDGAYVAPQDLPAGHLNEAQASMAYSDREEFASNAGHDTLTSSYESSQESTSSDGLESQPVNTVIIAFVGENADAPTENEELSRQASLADAYGENPYDQADLEKEKALRDAHFAWQQGNMGESQAIMEEEFMNRANHGFDESSSDYEGEFEAESQEAAMPSASADSDELSKAQAEIASLKEQLAASDRERKESNDRLESAQTDFRICQADGLEAEGKARDDAAAARQAMEDRDQALAQKEMLRKESIQAHSDAWNAKREAQVARAEAAQAREEADNANSRIEGADALTAKARQEAETARQDAQDVRAEMEEARAEADQLRAHADEIVSMNEDFRQQAIDASAQAETAQAKLDVIADADRADEAAKKLTRKLNRAEDVIARQYRKIDDHQQQIREGSGMKSMRQAQIRHNENVIDRKERKIAGMLADAQAACDRQYLARSIR